MWYYLQFPRGVDSILKSLGQFFPWNTIQKQSQVISGQLYKRVLAPAVAQSCILRNFWQSFCENELHGVVNKVNQPGWWPLLLDTTFLVGLATGG